MTRRFWWWGSLAVLAIGCGGERVDVDAGPLPETDSGMVVVPDGGGGCTDGDGDGYGVGCALGADCDDALASVSPAASETCDGVDQDCDGETDEALTGPSCALTEGVCAGATATCDGAAGFVCDASAYGDDYEETEAACDTLDNDCDGSTDESCACEPGATQACGNDVGVCEEGTQTCQADMTWGPCEGATDPMGESCDGEDNDCDGEEDESGDLTAPDCALQLGVCAGSKRACGGSGGWVTCAGTASYGGNYEAAESRCDELDNDCDGVTDEGCACVDGATQGCGTDIGACSTGTQTCIAGAWGACAGAVAEAPETCDGLDQDCDGDTDEDVVAPACALTVGACAGATQPCDGAGGFGACTAADYGADYEETETRCDGQDNDCNGEVDEGCDCIDGTTQECGESAGACERGTQTCSGGEWGACEGGVGPTLEDCNGEDDDCNGVTDDNLVRPACMLTTGVCAGSQRVCGGIAGWLACGGTESYGPRFLASEDGTANERVCDGLDNDCDGEVDDDCASGPLSSRPEDEITPDVFNRHIVYLVRFDGNWDVVFENVATGEERRLTTTPEDETEPRVYGNYVVFTRTDAGDTMGTSSRVWLHDLVTGAETRLGADLRAGAPDISQGFVIFEQSVPIPATDPVQFQWDLQLHNISTAETFNPLLGTETSDERLPSMRGGRIAYVAAEGASPPVTFVIDFGVAPPTVTAQTPGAITAAGQLFPVMDFTTVGWTDGRNLSSFTTDFTLDFDVYASRFGAAPAFPAEAGIVTAANGQVLTDIDGGILIWQDFRNGNWDVGIGNAVVGELLVTSSDATQADPTLSGNYLTWEDNRLGSFDIYQAILIGGSAPAGVDELVINEVMPNPGTVDVNGDGTASTTQDEYVEIINPTDTTLDIGGVEIHDAVGLKHRFDPGTTIPALGAIVVFGGPARTLPAAYSGLFGGAQLDRANSGALDLNNATETLTLRTAAGAVIDTATWSTSSAGVALTRTTELGADAMISHGIAEPGRSRSPGLRRDGFAF